MDKQLSALEVDGNEVVCRVHYAIFIVVILLAGAGFGTLFALAL